MKSPPTIYVIDDDARVLKSLEHLLRAANYMVEGFQSAARFLKQYDPARPGCVIVDLAMPGVDGLALHRELMARGGHSPVMFLSGHGSVPGSVQAMKQGAVDFLTKPIDSALLLQAVQAAVRRDGELREVQSRIAALTEREREVLGHVIAGELNKQIADHCGVAERTIKFHRANLIRKLGVTSAAQLTRLCIRGGIGGEHSTASNAFKGGQK